MMIFKQYLLNDRLKWIIYVWSLVQINIKKLVKHTHGLHSENKIA